MSTLGNDAGEPQAAGDGGKGEKLVVVGAVEGESLQDRFLRFRKERQRERGLSKRNIRATAAAGVKDIERLRERFVETCKGYIGVPYGQKHHGPEDPDHHAPLFLDCCGLVRRAVQDLQEDFGFRLGRWNQAYQFESLPKELSFEEMKPGDLIFVEGSYFDEKCRPQRHDIVHVEVFIGGETGEATIGSRWAKSNPDEGKVRGVQVHPCYKYTSKKYSIQKFHFRSLDTWLYGSCTSTSYGDALGTAASAAGKKSVFEDEAASDEEEDEQGAYVPNPYKEAPVFYVGEGNNWKAVATVLEARGWRRLPFEAAFSSRFDLKWVEARSKIDYKRHAEGQMVNHIPNNDVITSKTRFLQTMKAHEAATGERFGYHPSSYSSETAGEKLAALAEAEASPEALWILKPARGLGGIGIEIVRGHAELKERLFPRPRDLAEEPARPPPADGWVIQRYLEKPLLLSGRKFDLRAYCLVARTEPHLWLFHPGYCKVALEDYDASRLDSRYAHLTNACVQREHPDNKGSTRGRHIWSEAEALEALVASGQWTGEAGALWPKVHEEMKRCLVSVFKASAGLLERRGGYFDLLGVDFILDEDFGVHLLEVNSNPAMFFDSSPTLQELVPRLIGTTVDLTLEAQRPSQTTAVPDARGAFELIVDEAAGYLYGQA